MTEFSLSVPFKNSCICHCFTVSVKICRHLWENTEKAWHPTPVLLPGKSHGRRSLVGCSPWRRWGSDTTERLHFHFSLSCIGEGNGNRLQCSCLENPRDGGAWWAAVYGVAQSRTRLKWQQQQQQQQQQDISLKCKNIKIFEVKLWKSYSKHILTKIKVLDRY